LHATCWRAIRSTAAPRFNWRFAAGSQRLTREGDGGRGVTVGSNRGRGREVRTGPHISVLHTRVFYGPRQQGAHRRILTPTLGISGRQITHSGYAARCRLYRPNALLLQPTPSIRPLRRSPWLCVDRDACEARVRKARHGCVFRDPTGIWRCCHSGSYPEGSPSKDQRKPTSIGN
jgi:hypothetical protein